MKKNKSILLFSTIISSVGWVYETLLILALTGEFQDRGFVSLPFCPIYGITILLVYYIIGTPLSENGALIKHSINGLGIIKYYFFAMLIPTVCEFVGGNLMELFTGEVLWDYSSGDFSFGKYISLDASLLWGLLILLVMLFYDLIKFYINKIPDKLIQRINFTFCFAISFDFVGNMLLNNVMK